MGQKIFLFIPFALLTRLSLAQSVAGVEIGFTDNSINANISNRTSTILTSKSGYSAGLLFEFKVHSFFYLRLSPNISQKNYEIKRTDSLNGVFTAYSNTYIQLPLRLGVFFGKRFQVFSEIGGYSGYWIEGSLNGSVPNIFSVTDANGLERFSLTHFSQEYQFSSQTDNRFEFGWNAAVGVKYNLSKSYAAMVNCSYYQSLTSQQKNYAIEQIAQYNQTCIFSVGVLFSLK